MSDPNLQRRGRDTTLEMAALRLLDAIAALGKFVPGKKITYFEESPSGNDECLQRWAELDAAGKLARNVLKDRKDSELPERNEHDQDR